MAYVPGKSYDVFVSYAHADNAPADDASIAPTHRRGWVTQFVADLQRALRARLGGTEELRIFHDVRDAQGGGYPIDQLVQDVRASAVMLSVLSPSYVEERRPGVRPFTLQELDAFMDEPRRSQGNLFAVQILPFYDSAKIPATIQGVIRTDFWHATTRGVPFTVSHREPVEYEHRIHDLAEALNKRLRTLRDGAPQGSSGTVLLAQVTDDLEDEREEVLQYLQQFNIRVLPDADYPQSRGDFEAAFKADAARCDLVVQLLSKARGRRPSDVPQGHVRLQVDLAGGTGKLLQWRRPGMDVSALADLELRQLLDGTTVFADGLEAFKAEIVRQVRKRREPPPPPPPPPESGLAGGAAVYINAERPDYDEARRLAKRVSGSGRGHIVFTPLQQGTAEEIRADKEDHLRSCDALVLVYGRATPAWVRSQLSQYVRLRRQRDAPLRVLALYVEPAGERPDIDADIPDIVEFNLASVDEVLLGRLV